MPDKLHPKIKKIIEHLCNAKSLAPSVEHLCNAKSLAPSVGAKVSGY